MLAVGISKESSSPWVVHMIFAHTKSRDLCPLSGANKRTVKDAYHLPRPDEAQQYLVGSAVFLSLDLQNGHRKLQIHEEDRPKTAFSPGPSSAECPLVYQVYHLMDTVCWCAGTPLEALLRSLSAEFPDLVCVVKVQILTTNNIWQICKLLKCQILSPANTSCYVGSNTFHRLFGIHSSCAATI